MATPQGTETPELRNRPEALNQLGITYLSNTSQRQSTHLEGKDLNPASKDGFRSPESPACSQQSSDTDTGPNSPTEQCNPYEAHVQILRADIDVVEKRLQAYDYEASVEASIYWQVVYHHTRAMLYDVRRRLKAHARQKLSQVLPTPQATQEELPLYNDTASEVETDILSELLSPVEEASGFGEAPPSPVSSEGFGGISDHVDSQSLSSGFYSNLTAVPSDFEDAANGTPLEEQLATDCEDHNHKCSTAIPNTEPSDHNNRSTSNPGQHDSHSKEADSATSFGYGEDSHSAGEDENIDHDSISSRQPDAPPNYATTHGSFLERIDSHTDSESFTASFGPSGVSYGASQQQQQTPSKPRGAKRKYEEVEEVEDETDSRPHKRIKKALLKTPTFASSQFKTREIR